MNIILFYSFISNIRLVSHLSQSKWSGMLHFYHSILKIQKKNKVNHVYTYKDSKIRTKRLKLHIIKTEGM